MAFSQRRRNRTEPFHQDATVVATVYSTGNEHVVVDTDFETGPI